MENTGNDNQSTGDTDTTNSAQDNQSDSTQNQDGSADITAQKTQYQPFISGKERFKIDGKEEELDWETAKKYVSLGKTGYQRMSEAASLKKQVNEAYQQLLDLAKSDPEGLIRTLNPNYQGSNGQSQRTPTESNSVADNQQDPRDYELRTLREEMAAIKSFHENQQIQNERQAIESELGEAETKYSVLKGNKFAMNYIKSEYRKALMNNADASIDDIAFHVAQEIKNERSQSLANSQKRNEQKRNQAPITVGAAPSGSAAKEMTFDEVKRIAGLK